MSIQLTKNEINLFGHTGYYDRLQGEFYADPHAPYHWLDGFEDERGEYGVCYQDSEEYVFGPFKTEEEAVEFTALLNKNYHDRQCRDDSSGYSCVICGDITDKGRRREEEEVRNLYQREDDQVAVLVAEAEAREDYHNGEDWSDSPACASPVISAFMRSWNDSGATSH